MTQVIDHTTYLRLPRLDVASAISLGKMLLAATPKSGTAPVKKAAKKVHASVKALEGAWKQRVRTETATDLRPVDRQLDVRWGALFERIAAFQALDEHPDKQARATELVQLVFPDGLAFLKLPYVAEHAESQRRLDIIAERTLTSTVDELAGKEFLAAVRAAHAAYGEALGITKAAPARPGDAPTLNEPLRALTDAVAAYNVQLLAFAAHDDASAAAARQALSPVDKFRQAQGRRGSGLPADAPPPDAPTPPPPADSPAS